MALEEAVRLRAEGRLQEAETLALRADLAAGNLDRAFGLARVADLRCRLWLEIVNLRRARNFLDGAENALVTAEECLAESSGDSLLAARLFDVAASLYRDQGRFHEAETSLNRAYHLYLRESKQAAGKVLVKLAIVKVDTHEPGRALDLLVQAQPLLAGCEPRLSLIVAHNIFMALADAGETDIVARLLWTWRRYYERVGTPRDRIRLLGLEARVAFGQGHSVHGEKCYRRQINGFQKAGLPFDAAVAALELAGRLQERGKTRAVLELLNGAVAAFVEGHIYRELSVSLTLLRSAVEAGQATAEMIATFAETLRQAETAAGGRR